MSSSSRSYFSLALAGFAAILFAVVLFAPQLLGDGDTYWHLAVGAWIISHAQIPRGDIFSYTMAGHPWIAQEWLSEVAMAAAFRVAGWAGLMILFASATGGAVILLGTHLRRWIEPLPLLLAMLMALSVISPSLIARPHLLVLPVMEIWCAGLVIAREQGRAPPVWLLPLMVLWTNMHGSFPAGLVLVGLLSCEAAAADIRQAGPWFGFTFASIASTLLNPYGIDGALFPLRLINSGALTKIDEWQATDFNQNPPIAEVLGLILYLGLVRGFTLPPWRFLIFVGLLYASLLHFRNQMLVGIIGLPVIAPSLGRFFGVQRAPAVGEARRSGLIFFVAAAALSLLRLVHPLVRGDDSVTPQTALAHVPLSLRAMPVFNDDAFGGYLIFAGVKPFIDGRADLYGSEFNERYYRSMTLPGSLFADQLTRYQVRWAVVSPTSPAITAFSALPAWRCLYRGKTAVVYVLRQDATPLPAGRE